MSSVNNETKLLVHDNDNKILEVNNIFLKKINWRR